MARKFLSTYGTQKPTRSDIKAIKRLALKRRVLIIFLWALLLFLGIGYLYYYIFLGKTEDDYMGIDGNFIISMLPVDLFCYILVFIPVMIYFIYKRKQFKNIKKVRVVRGIITDIDRGRFNFFICIGGGQYYISWIDSYRLEPGMYVEYRYLSVNVKLSVKRLDRKMYDTDKAKKKENESDLKAGIPLEYVAYPTSAKYLVGSVDKKEYVDYFTRWMKIGFIVMAVGGVVLFVSNVHTDSYTFIKAVKIVGTLLGIVLMLAGTIMVVHCYSQMSD